MTAQQTSVARQTEGYAGQLADADDGKYARSYLSEDAAEIAFGFVVKGGTDPDTQVKLPTAAADKPRGVVLHSHAYDKAIELGDFGLKTNATVSVLRRGVVKVTCSEAVVVDTSAVRLRMDTNAGAAGTALGPGSFAVSANAGHTTNVTSGMKWIKGCGAGGIAHLEVDMDAYAATAD